MKTVTKTIVCRNCTTKNKVAPGVPLREQFCTLCLWALELDPPKVGDHVQMLNGKPLVVSYRGHRFIGRVVDVGPCEWSGCKFGENCALIAVEGYVGGVNRDIRELMTVDESMVVDETVE